MLDYIDCMSQSSAQYPATLPHSTQTIEVSNFRQSILASKNLKERITHVAQEIRQIDSFQQSHTERKAKVAALFSEIDGLESLVNSLA
jgi:hypothetical protein